MSPSAIYEGPRAVLMYVQDWLFVIAALEDRARDAPPAVAESIRGRIDMIARQIDRHAGVPELREADTPGPILVGPETAPDPWAARVAAVAAMHAAGDPACPCSVCLDASAKRAGFTEYPNPKNTEPGHSAPDVEAEKLADFRVASTRPKR